MSGARPWPSRSVAGERVSVGRIVARYRIDGRDVAVLETLDEGGSWFGLVVDGAAVPLGEGLAAVPDEQAAAVALRRWLDEA